MIDDVQKKTIIVVDVPPNVAPEQAELLLNAACERGYYVLAVLPGVMGGARGYFGKRREPLLRGNKPKSNTDGKQDAALAIIKANPCYSIRQLVNRMQDAGIIRGKSWVSEKRMELGRNGLLGN